MSQRTEQNDVKKDITAQISEETQIAMMNFFMRTSVPRILKQQEQEAKKKELAERE